MVKEFIFLCGHRKCGTTLLSNLFDNHPSMSVFPVDIAFYYLYYPYYVKTSNIDRRIERIKKVILMQISQILARTNISVDLYLDYFFEDFDPKLSDNMQYIVTRAFDSLTRAGYIGQKEEKVSVAKETSIEIYAKEIFQMFPKCKMIQIVRDPRDNYSALKSGVSKYYSRLGEDEKKTLASLINRAKLGFEMAKINKSRFGSNKYYVVKFEDLVINTKEVMTEISDFIGIEFADSLLTPTILGKKTTGNNHDGQQFKGVDIGNVGRWPDRITEEEAQIIEYHFGEVMIDFGYKLEYDKTQSTDSAVDFYKWLNYHYFFSDPLQNYNNNKGDKQ